MRIIVILTILFIVMGCDSSMVYDKSNPIKNSLWNRNSKQEFFVEIKDTASYNNIYINFRHTGLYPYSNLYVFLKTILPSGQSNTDTLEMILADDNGRWYGSGLGDIKSYSIPYRNKVKFMHSGLYVFEIEHAMRDIDLKGILNIGVRVEKSK